MNKFLKDLLYEIKNETIVNLQDEIEKIDTSEQKVYPENIDKIKDMFYVIQHLTDLDGETIQAEEYFWDAIKDLIIDNPNNFWNESITALMRTYDRIYNIFESATILNEDSAKVNGKVIAQFVDAGDEIYYQTFNTTDLKQGDAGNSFEEKWVKPWYNTDAYLNQPDEQQSYSYVRGADKNTAALNSDKHLQFTREQTDEIVKQIRLLMMKNSRRVEIEDLNRNFWVIAQIITGITAYLYGDDSPFQCLFKDILKELVELWENILYQWGMTLLYMTPPVTDIKIEFFPLANDIVHPYNKFDNFNNDTILLDDIKNKIKFYQYKYNRHHLILVPYIRQNNYQKNYYNKIIIPYICFYNRDTDTWSYCQLLDQTTNDFLTIYPDKYNDKIYGAREKEIYYKYAYPLSSITSQTESYGPFRYYGALRIIPTIRASISQGKIKINKFELQVQDGIQNIVLNSNQVNDLVALYDVRENFTEETESVFCILEREKQAPAQDRYISLTEERQKRAYYLGEMPSCFVLSSNQPYLIYQNNIQIIGDGSLFKIGNYLPKGYATEINNPIYCAEQLNPGDGLTDYIWNLTIPSYKTGADINLIRSWYDNFGGAYVKPANDCYLYVPTMDNGNLKQKLLPTKQENTDFHTQDYQDLGYDVISEYIKYKRSIGETINAINYYIGAVGIRPWHNGSKQGYFSTNILTHMYRYIPLQWLPYVEYQNSEIITVNNIPIGALQVLGVVDKIETAFVSGANEVFAKPMGSTWRLPQLVPEKHLRELLIYQEGLTGLYYFVDQQKDPSLSNLSIAELTERLNNQFDYYCQKGVIMTPNDIKDKLRSPSGIWEVYDGEVKNTTGNTHGYIRDPRLREVAYTNFEFDEHNSIIFKTPTRGRILNDMTALENKQDGMDYNGTVMLPPTGFNDMELTW